MTTVDITEQLAGYTAQAPDMQPASFALSLQVVARQPLPPGAKFATVRRHDDPPKFFGRSATIRKRALAGVIGHREHRSAVSQAFRFDMWFNESSRV
jgi:hypothetical protein